MRTWAVTMTQQICSPQIKDPGCPSSVPIGILRYVPSVLDQAPKVATYFLTS